MQKNISDTITVGFPWKDHTESVAIYNNSGEFSNSEAQKTQSQQINLDAGSSIIEINASSSGLEGQDTTNTSTNSEFGQQQKQLSFDTQRGEAGRKAGIPSAENKTTNPSSNNEDSSLNTTKSPEAEAELDVEANSGLDPAVSENGPSNKRKRLSGTKRAAQNRSAQKAFRERREKYVKNLEATALRVEEMQKTIDQLRQENADLRGYALALQSRFVELNPSETNHMP